MIDFLHTTKKREGSVNLTELAVFLEKKEATVRALQRTNPKKFDLLYMGAVCSVNGISLKDLKGIYNLIKSLY